MIKQIVVVISLFLSLSACEPSVSMQTQYVSPQCIPSQSRCFVETSIGRFDIMFDLVKIKSETEFHVDVMYQGNIKLKAIKGYIEGKNMFMGKIPLFFKKVQDTDDYNAPLMLASCSENEMTWVLWLTAESFENKLIHAGEGASKAKLTTFFIEFDSKNY
jgi:hypothetical protein